MRLQVSGRSVHYATNDETVRGFNGFDVAESDAKFFPTASDVEIEFFKEDRGTASYLMLRQNGRERKALKK
jgi:hypothetical protein